jgi:dihydropteroate synthase
MGILNLTPDSFSDGGQFNTLESALARTEQMIAEGADIVDIGGESTRPGSTWVSSEAEIARVVPVIEAVCKRFDVPVSVDTSKAEVAGAALDAGAEIVNDISGLRWDEKMAEVAAASVSGLVLMHSRGDFETMHSLPPVDDVIVEVTSGLKWSVEKARSCGVGPDQIALDVGIGFGKSPEQNLELIANLERLAADLGDHLILVGVSRKSFIGRILGDVPPDERLGGSLSAAAIAVWNGASIVRCHDIKETSQAVRVASALRKFSAPKAAKSE